MWKRFFVGRQVAPSVPSGRRVYAIGDIHGRLDLMDRLLAAIRKDDEARPVAETTVILLGDLIDRGPESRAVVQRAMAGLEWARLAALTGNHEAVMLDSLDGDQQMLARWLRVGGRTTLESWGLDPGLLDGPADALRTAMSAALSREELAWLRTLPLSVQIGDYFFVHAGIRPGVPLDRQSAEDCQWIREEFLTSTRAHDAVIVHGHTITGDAEFRPNRIGIDTGAYATDRLTALGLEAEDRWLLQT